MSYGFPILNFCNPGVHYEMPCICTNENIEFMSVLLYIIVNVGAGIP